MAGLKNKPENSVYPGVPREWFDTVERLCNIDVLKQMLIKQSDIIMARTAGGNQKEYMKLFDKVILFKADPQTLVNRMHTRSNKTGYGKSKGEQDDNIEW